MATLTSFNHVNFPNFNNSLSSRNRATATMYSGLNYTKKTIWDNLYILVYFFGIYITFVLFIVIISLFILLHLKNQLYHKFWYNQPVLYNTYLKTKYASFNTNKVIKTNLKFPKYINYDNIKFINTIDLTSDSLSILCNIINTNTTNHNLTNNITCNQLYKELINYSTTTFIGIYKNNFSSINDILVSKIPAKLENHDIDAFITIVPLEIKLFKDDQSTVNIHSNTKYKNNIYFANNVYVKEVERKKGLCKQLIATTIDHIINNNAESMIGLFKSEGYLLEFLHPITSYERSSYHIGSWFKKSFDIHPSTKLLKINKQNLNLVYAFLVNNDNNRFKLMIYPDMYNTAERINDNNPTYIIYTIMLSHTICSIYIFKHAISSHYGKKTIQLTASINNNNSDDFFVQGFYNCLEEIYKNHEYEILDIEGQSDNLIIRNYINKRNSSFLTCDVGWYLYNYSLHSLSSKDTLILS